MKYNKNDKDTITNEEVLYLRLKLRTCPKYVQKIMQMSGGFKDYDVVYDDESQISQLEKRAAKCDVELNNDARLSVDAASESCSGRLIDCFIYLLQYLKSDGGYIGGATMYIDQLRNVSDDEFNLFCAWINEGLPDFIAGIKDNPQLGNRAKALGIIHEDDVDNDEEVEISLQLPDMDDYDEVEKFIIMAFGRRSKWHNKLFYSKDNNYSSHQKIFGYFWTFIGPRWMCRKLWAMTLCDDIKKPWWTTSDHDIPEKYGDGIDTPYSNPANFDDVLRPHYLDEEDANDNLGAAASWTYREWMRDIDPTENFCGYDFKAYVDDAKFSAQLKSKIPAHDAYFKPDDGHYADCMFIDFKTREDAEQFAMQRNYDYFVLAQFLASGFAAFAKDKYDEWRGDYERQCKKNDMSLMSKGTADYKNSQQHVMWECAVYEKEAFLAEDEDGAKNAPDIKELRSKIDDAKKEAAKVKNPEDVKKFLADNKAKIDELSKKMKGEQKKAFDAVISKMEEYADGKQLNEGDNSAKVICGCVAVIMWLIGLGPAWIVGALSPIVGPVLLNVVKKIV